jgi:hypothetical protein
MPIHDWTRVYAGIFHDFHQRWCVRIQDRLNAGVLPPDHYALLEPTSPDPVDGFDGPSIGETLQRVDEEGVADATVIDTRAACETPPVGWNAVVIRTDPGDKVVQVIRLPLRPIHPLPDMPVFLRPGGHVPLPLEATYTSAYDAVPARWRRVIEGT